MPIDIVYAGWKERDASVTDDGNEAAFSFNEDALGDGNGWIDCRMFSEITLEAHADTAAVGNAATFTIEGLVTAAATAYDFQAGFAVASNTVDRTTVTSADCTAIGYCRVLVDGTSGDVHTARLLFK